MNGNRVTRLMVDFAFAPRATCMGCGSELGCDRDWLCAKCYAALQPLYACAQSESRLCPECGEERAGAACPRCGRKGGEALVAYAAYPYAPPVDAMIRRFKYGSVYRMDDWFAGEMEKAIRASAPFHPTVIVPVPLHVLRKARRGFNQSEKLAAALSRRLGVPTRNALKRVRNTASQARFKEAERRKNVLGAFRAEGRLDGERILLVDDVRSTGSTVLACAKALTEAGADAVAVVTVATPRNPVGENDKNQH